MTLQEFIRKMPDVDLGIMVVDILFFNETNPVPILTTPCLAKLSEQLDAAGVSKRDDLRQAGVLLVREAASRYVDLSAAAARMNTTKDGVEVKIGQVWEDMEKRMEGRRCRVRAIENGKAVMGSIHRDTGPTSKISISRMHQGSAGWKLIA